jgi:hypothetical protein
MPQSGRINFFLSPAGISLWEGESHSTLRLPDDRASRENLFRELIARDGLEGEVLDKAVQRMAEKAEAYKPTLPISKPEPENLG